MNNKNTNNLYIGLGYIVAKVGFEVFKGCKSKKLSKEIIEEIEKNSFDDYTVKGAAYRLLSYAMKPESKKFLTNLSDIREDWEDLCKNQTPNKAEIILAKYPPITATIEL